MPSLVATHPNATSHKRQPRTVRRGEEEARSARTRAKNISILKGFFEWALLTGRMHGDPARPIKPPRKRGVERTVFSPDQEGAILSDQPERRDRIALHLLLKVGIRKGALQTVRFKHFDHAQRRLTVFTKGGKVQTVPVIDPAFWNELERAGVVSRGVTRGERMHKSRHTAGQRLLDQTRGNLKAVQKLLGHSSITTTGDIYTDWDIDQLEQTLREALEKGET